MAEHAPSPNNSAPATLIPVQVAIGVATVPLLAALVSSRVVAATLQNLGVWSEELFRGDRLPSLTPPVEPPPNP